MKKRILLISAIAIGSLTLSSYEFGPAATGYLNCTGSTGGVASCGGGSCHSSNTSATSALIQLLDSSGSPATEYIPGARYTVKITGTNTNVKVHKAFGFQLSVVNTSKTQIGTFSLSSSSAGYIQVTPLGGLSIVEHSSPIDTNSSGGYTVPDIYWTAPASGSGNATFYAIINAVNLDHNVSGDQPNAATPLVITPKPTAVAKVIQNIDIKTYPNPFNNHLTLITNTHNTTTASANVFDLNGKCIYKQTFTTNSNLEINTVQWPTGMYLLQIQSANQQRTLSLVKK